MVKAKVRLVLAAAFASTCMSVSLGSQLDLGNQEAAATKQHLVIRLFNLARVPRRDLARAQGELIRIFAQAGMEVRWAEGDIDDRASLSTDSSANNSSPAGCKVASQEHELRLQLLSHAPRGVTPETLGYSLPCATSGIDSTIYIDHCEAVTYETLAPFNKVLAYVMAHELGHVLLRSDKHSPTGLMRARWDRTAWLLATLEGIPIDREEAGRMRIELSRMELLFTEGRSQ